PQPYNPNPIQKPQPFVPIDPNPDFGDKLIRSDGDEEESTLLGDLLKDPGSPGSGEGNGDEETLLGQLIKEQEPETPPANSSTGHYPVPGRQGERDVDEEFYRSTVTTDKTFKRYKNANGEIVSGQIHAGYDICGNLDEPIISPMEGKVIINDDLTAYGNRIMVEYLVNGKYYYVTYAHLNGESGYGVGATIAAGAQLGLMGSTGTGSGGTIHLHLDVRCANDPSTPLSAGDARPSTGKYHFVNPNEFFNAINISL
ncbi:MAG: peptidoglycan DD-metalloendopeptidase family protein, partial [Peptococcaceae bacterium]|nr:peptidoglycan DD-metalloendopeptidase family protein [Peptococcaceae bacterium]